MEMMQVLDPGQGFETCGDLIEIDLGGTPSSAMSSEARSRDQVPRMIDTQTTRLTIGRELPSPSA